MTESFLHLTEQGVAYPRTPLYLGGDYFTLDGRSKIIYITEPVEFLIFDEYDKSESKLIYTFKEQVQFFLRPN